jgi:hypothetical protein
MKMKIICVIIVLLLACNLFAEKAAVLPEILKPGNIFIDDTQLYITEGITVHIYSLTDFSKVAKFGKQGEGPQEFKGSRFAPSPLYVDTQTENLLISSTGKVSRFTKQGNFLNEQKLTTGFGIPNFQPIGKGFARIGFSREDNTFYNIVSLCDDQFKQVKVMGKRKNPFQRGKKMNPLKRPAIFYTDNTCNIVVSESDNDGLTVYDAEGNKKLSIAPDIKKIALTSEHKEKVLDFYQNDPRVKQFWGFLKNNIQFPSYLPLTFAFYLADCKIYILTYYRKDNTSLFLIYDKAGKLISKKYLPIAYRSFIDPYPFVINDNKIFQLIENEDDEEWELHITEMK